MKARAICILLIFLIAWISFKSWQAQRIREQQALAELYAGALSRQEKDARSTGWLPIKKVPTSFDEEYFVLTYPRRSAGPENGTLGFGIHDRSGAGLQNIWTELPYIESWNLCWDRESRIWIVTIDSAPVYWERHQDGNWRVGRHSMNTSPPAHCVLQDDTAESSQKGA